MPGQLYDRDKLRATFAQATPRANLTFLSSVRSAIFIDAETVYSINQPGSDISCRSLAEPAGR
jgi:hypothetical protein